MKATWLFTEMTVLLIRIRLVSLAGSTGRSAIRPLPRYSRTNRTPSAQTLVPCYYTYSCSVQAHVEAPAGNDFSYARIGEAVEKAFPAGADRSAEQAMSSFGRSHSQQSIGDVNVATSIPRLSPQ